MGVIIYYQGSDPENNQISPSEMSPESPSNFVPIPESPSQIQSSNNGSNSDSWRSSQIRYYQNNNNGDDDEIEYGRFDENKHDPPPAPVKRSYYQHSRHRYDPDFFPIVRNGNGNGKSSADNNVVSNSWMHQSAPVSVPQSKEMLMLLDLETPPGQDADILIDIYSENNNNSNNNSVKSSDELTPVDLSFETEQQPQQQQLSPVSKLYKIYNQIDTIPAKVYSSGSSVSVGVGEISSPNNFYIFTKELCEKFNYFQQSLNAFYENCPKVNFSLNANGWYAAKVPNSRFGDYGRVKLIAGNIYSIGHHCLFVDHGITAYLDESKLVLLDDRFKLFPQLAAKARLYGLKPPSGIWSTEITQHFKELINGSYRLFASVMDNDDEEEEDEDNVDEDGNSLVSVMLSSETKSVNINMELCEMMENLLI